MAGRAQKGARRPELSAAALRPLLDGLNSPRPAVRVAMFAALIRLPLDRDARSAVVAFATRALTSKDSRERTAVVRTIDEHIGGEPVRETGKGGGRNSRTTGSIVNPGDPLPATVWDAQPSAPLLEPSWAQGKRLGFSRHSDSRQAEAARLLRGITAAGGEPTEVRAALDGAWKAGLGAAIATAAFASSDEDTQLQLRNAVVQWVAALRAQYRPDPAGLFVQYRKHAFSLTSRTDLFDRVTAVLRPSRPSTVSGQIAWMLSRGGISGLVQAMGPFLTSDNTVDQVAAACLVASATESVGALSGPIIASDEIPQGTLSSPALPRVGPAPRRSAATDAGDFLEPTEVRETQSGEFRRVLSPVDDEGIGRPAVIKPEQTESPSGHDSFEGLAVDPSGSGESAERPARRRRSPRPGQARSDADGKKQTTAGTTSPGSATGLSRSGRSGRRSPTTGSRKRAVKTPALQRGHAKRRSVQPPKPRWILAKMYQASSGRHRAVTRALRADTDHIVEVQIGPVRTGLLVATGGAAIDDSLPDPGQPKSLTFMFTPPRGKPVVGEPVVLPPVGATDVRSFSFRTGAARSEFRARIDVLYRNRILQRAVIRGRVVDDPTAAAGDDSISFRVAVVRPGFADLDAREPFDLAMVRSGSPTGPPSTVAVHDEEVIQFDESRLSLGAQRITERLTDLALNPDLYDRRMDSPANVQLLRDLAFTGVELFKVIGAPVAKAMRGREVAKLQVLVTDADEFIPVEFVYEFAVPTKDAGLCPNWDAALRAGHCSSSHHPPAPDNPAWSTVVCPLGFWALSKVIERQVLDEEQTRAGARTGVRREPTAQRQHLTEFGSAIFAASDRADPNKTGLEAQVLETLRLMDPNATQVASWRDWLTGVRLRRPALQLLLSHTADVRGNLALQIGTSDDLMLAQIDAQVVRPYPDMAPVVLLLGCGTATDDQHLHTFVNAFRTNGAALVVGTVAPVLGRRAAPVAAALVRALHTASTPNRQTDGVCFGDVMLTVRRTLLSDGEQMALCLTSFGDVDWRVQV